MIMSGLVQVEVSLFHGIRGNGKFKKNRRGSETTLGNIFLATDQSSYCFYVVFCPSGVFIDLFWDKCFCRFFWIVLLLGDCSGANVYYMTPGCYYVGVESF